MTNNLKPSLEFLALNFEVISCHHANFHFVEIPFAIFKHYVHFYAFNVLNANMNYGNLNKCMEMVRKFTFMILGAFV